MVTPDLLHPEAGRDVVKHQGPWFIILSLLKTWRCDDNALLVATKKVPYAGINSVSSLIQDSKHDDHKRDDNDSIMYQGA